MGEVSEGERCAMRMTCAFGREWKAERRVNMLALKAGLEGERSRWERWPKLDWTSIRRKREGLGRGNRGKHSVGI